ncbi:MAG: hypothetical protein ABSF51_12410 [Verrucomicrobiota bacterium]|jgi:hypothetical protein
MKMKQSSILVGMLVLASVPLATVSSLAQTTNIVVYNFNTADQVNGTLAPYTDAWGNWYGTSYYNVLWSTNDANNNPSSGSMEIESIFPDSLIGGCCGPQFTVYDQNNGVQDVLGGTPLNGNGSAATNFVVTNITFDIMIDPSSTDTNSNGANYPPISVFTRGTAYNQNSFGSVSIPLTNAGVWVHESFPVTPNANWATIPNVGFNHYSTTETGTFNFYVDNIAFQEGIVSFPPPNVSIQKSSPALRIFAGSSINTYDREQLTSLDHNQSWVGGTYPVSYSYTLKSFPTIPSGSVFRFHIFLVPVNNAGGNSFSNNEYIEYQANNDLWLNVNATNPTNVWADVAFKTNLPNANPNDLVTLTNSTAVGTWTLAFNSATSGTVTAPGGASANFTLPDGATIAADFGNPLVAFFGVQPDSGYGEGQYVDVAKISTVGVAAPGVAINDDFTSDTSINTNIWDVSNSANPASLVLATSNSPWWVYWTTPAFGFGPATKADIGNSSIPWKSPYYYANYVTNGAPTQEANNIWFLLNSSYLPTVNGLSNGPASPNAFFLVTKPPPAQ